jgi:hypothetical protein
MNLLKLMPMAFVMVAGPQILSAIFFATRDDWRKTSAVYVLGSALSISIVVSAAFLLTNGASNGGTSDDTIYWIVLGLLLFGMINTFRIRKTAEPPKWMGKLQTATPQFAFTLGFLLLGVFPSDLITSISVGGYLNAQGDPLWHYLGFLAVTLLFLATPALLVALMGKRAKAFLPKVREWMNDNSWIVNELVLLLFVFIVGGNLT